MKKKHLATCGIMGFGNRIGTRFMFSPEEVKKNFNAPYFKFRNEQCYRKYVEYFQNQEKEK